MNATDFLDDVESYLDTSGMPPTAFGTAAVNDPRFVFDLRNGRSCSLRMVQRVYEFIQKNRSAPHKGAR